MPRQWTERDEFRTSSDIWGQRRSTRRTYKDVCWSVAVYARDVFDDYRWAWAVGDACRWSERSRTPSDFVARDRRCMDTELARPSCLRLAPTTEKYHEVHTWRTKTLHIRSQHKQTKHRGRRVAEYSLHDAVQRRIAFQNDSWPLTRQHVFTLNSSSQWTAFIHSSSSSGVSSPKPSCSHLSHSWQLQNLSRRTVPVLTSSTELFNSVYNVNFIFLVFFEFISFNDALLTELHIYNALIVNFNFRCTSNINN